MIKSPTINSKIDTPVKQQLVVALYARVSTEKQEDEQTVKVQIAEIKDRIISDGNILPKENIFIDDGWTGSLLPRPSLDKMRTLAAERKFEALYVYDRGRLARKYAYQEIVIEELEDRGIKFISLKDKAVESEDDRVVQGMQGLFAEWERTKIAERFRIGKLRRAESGRLINGQVPYGYTRIKKTEDTPAQVTINEEEAEVVRRVFNWVGNERLSLREVRRRLHKEGVPPRKRKQEYWTEGPINRLLQNEVYVTGNIYFNKSESMVAKNPKNKSYKRIKKTSRRMRERDVWIPYKVPSIFEERTLFDEVQEILQRNKREKVAHPKYEYLLTGIIWCACGMRRVGDGSSRHGHCYYRCAERLYKFNQERTCYIAGLNAAALDFTLWNELSGFLQNPDFLRSNAEASIREFQQASSKPDNHIARIEKLIEQIDKEIERYTKAYGAGALELEQFQELIRDSRRRKNNHLIQINNAKEEELANIVAPLQIDDLIAESSKVLKRLDLSNKKEVIRDVIDKVIVGLNDIVEVCGHINITREAEEGLGSYAKDWNRRSAKCGEINSV